MRSPGGAGVFSGWVLLGFFSYCVFWGGGGRKEMDDEGLIELGAGRRMVGGGELCGMCTCLVDFFSSGGF